MIETFIIIRTRIRASHPSWPIDAAELKHPPEEQREQNILRMKLAVSA